MICKKMGSATQVVVIELYYNGMNIIQEQSDVLSQM